MKRRSFLTSPTLTATAASTAAAAPPEFTVARAVRHYGHTVGSPRLDRSTGQVEIRAHITDPSAFAEVFTNASHPFGPIRAAGNTLTFTHRGTAFRLEHTV